MDNGFGLASNCSSCFLQAADVNDRSDKLHRKQHALETLSVASQHATTRSAEFVPADEASESLELTSARQRALPMQKSIGALPLHFEDVEPSFLHRHTTHPVEAAERSGVFTSNFDFRGRQSISLVSNQDFFKQCSNPLTVGGGRENTSDNLSALPSAIRSCYLFAQGRFSLLLERFHLVALISRYFHSWRRYLLRSAGQRTNSQSCGLSEGLANMPTSGKFVPHDFALHTPRASSATHEVSESCPSESQWRLHTVDYPGMATFFPRCMDDASSNGVHPPCSYDHGRATTPVPHDVHPGTSVICNTLNSSACTSDVSDSNLALSSTSMEYVMSATRGCSSCYVEDTCLGGCLQSLTVKMQFYLNTTRVEESAARVSIMSQENARRGELEKHVSSVLDWHFIHALCPKRPTFFSRHMFPRGDMEMKKFSTGDATDERERPHVGKFTGPFEHYPHASQSKWITPSVSSSLSVGHLVAEAEDGDEGQCKPVEIPAVSPRYKETEAILSHDGVITSEAWEVSPNVHFVVSNHTSSVAEGDLQESDVTEPLGETGSNEYNSEVTVHRREASHVPCLTSACVADGTGSVSGNTGAARSGGVDDDTMGEEGVESICGPNSDSGCVLWLALLQLGQLAVADEEHQQRLQVAKQYHNGLKHIINICFKAPRSVTPETDGNTTAQEGRASA
ncbi:hypothetical protein TRVL_02765 [Trypanosoma vivax]|nr:hypothetical protein TRVL_02765 [Trypanosoma vivax]